MYTYIFIHTHLHIDIYWTSHEVNMMSHDKKLSQLPNYCNQEATYGIWDFLRWIAVIFFFELRQHRILSHVSKLHIPEPTARGVWADWPILVSSTRLRAAAGLVRCHARETPVFGCNGNKPKNPYLRFHHIP